MALRVVRHFQATTFLRRAEPWLMRAEAEHNLLLGLARRLMRSTAGFEPPIYLATIENDEGVVGCAFRTPPFKLGVTRMPVAAVPVLVDDVATVYSNIPGVLGPDPEAARVAALWSSDTGLAVWQAMRNRIYQLVEVLPPRHPPPGHVRVATPADRELVAGWLADFTSEAHIHPAGSRARIRCVTALHRHSCLETVADIELPGNGSCANRFRAPRAGHCIQFGTGGENSKQQTRPSAY